MKVTLSDDEHVVGFGTLSIGDVFVYNNVAYMKTSRLYFSDTSQGSWYNCIRLSDGASMSFTSSTHVRPKHNTEVIVK